MKFVQVIAASMGFALMSAHAIEVSGQENDKGVKAKEVCIEGHAFAVAYSGTGTSRERGVAIVQVFETVSSTSRPQPKTCN